MDHIDQNRMFIFHVSLNEIRETQKKERLVNSPIDLFVFLSVFRRMNEDTKKRKIHASLQEV